MTPRGCLNVTSAFERFDLEMSWKTKKLWMNFFVSEINWTLIQFFCDENKIEFCFKKSQRTRTDNPTFLGLLKTVIHHKMNSLLTNPFKFFRWKLVSSSLWLTLFIYRSRRVRSQRTPRSLWLTQIRAVFVKSNERWREIRTKWRSEKRVSMRFANWISFPCLKRLLCLCKWEVR